MTLGIYDEVRKALIMCKKEGLRPLSIGIDSWGIDFGCLGPHGELLGAPRAYRDPYTKGAPEEVYAAIPRDELYKMTGIQVMPFNTLFQLYRAANNDDPCLQAARRVLFIPDLLAYMMTGEVVCEYTIASTSQMLDPVTRTFNKELLRRAGIKRSLLTTPIMPGTKIGCLTKRLALETGLGQVDVVAVAGHDTASAVSAVPASGEIGDDRSYAYLSSGTWSLMGVEVDKPIINKESLKNNFTNEGGADNNICFLKNMTGMWILEECKREWAARGVAYSYEDMVVMAMSALPSSTIIDTDYHAFDQPNSMLRAINAYCLLTGQAVPHNDAATISLIFRSLAAKYKETLNTLKRVSQSRIGRLHVIGGGSRNSYLNRLTADAACITLVAGPAEATAIGNIMIQARRAGVVKDRLEARRIIARSFPPQIFRPHDINPQGTQYNNNNI
ncbi:MAG: rhamnulokinase [Tannerellaceae bacterium]|jgi:rhamnulokinase|nr:rhamnulokinase [Tannerellaceae bacterium]